VWALCSGTEFDRLWLGGRSAERRESFKGSCGEQGRDTLVAKKESKSRARS